mgnify:CR=1 FL=1
MAPGSDGAFAGEFRWVRPGGEIAWIIRNPAIWLEPYPDVLLEDMPIIPMWSGKTAVVASDAVSDVRYDQGDGEIAFAEISVNQ